VTTHDLHDEGSLMACCGGGEVVDCRDDVVQSGVGTDRHVGADEVVVDGPHQPGNHEVGMLLGGLLGDLTGADEFIEQTWPLGS
jgi:hypothetical protein